MWDFGGEPCGIIEVSAFDRLEQIVGVAGLLQSLFFSI